MFIFRHGKTIAQRPWTFATISERLVTRFFLSSSRQHKPWLDRKMATLKRPYAQHLLTSQATTKLPWWLAVLSQDKSEWLLSSLSWLEMATVFKWALFTQSWEGTGRQLLSTTSGLCVACLMDEEDASISMRISIRGSWTIGLTLRSKSHHD